MNLETVTLDVRPDIRSGKHPFQKIQDAFRQAGAGQAIRLLAPFEPVPLYHVADGQGFEHKSSQTTEGDWEVIFTRKTATDAKPVEQSSPQPKAGNCNDTPDIIDVDARHLEPPQPLVRILEALARLRNGASLRARTDRRPIHLYSHLEERGFAGQSEEQSDGSFITHIRRA